MNSKILFSSPSITTWTLLLVLFVPYACSLEWTGTEINGSFTVQQDTILTKQVKLSGKENNLRIVGLVKDYNRQSDADTVEIENLINKYTPNGLRRPIIKPDKNVNEFENMFYILSGAKIYLKDIILAKGKRCMYGHKNSKVYALRTAFVKCKVVGNSQCVWTKI